MPRNLWNIENVDAETRRKVKAYAASKGLTIAEALSQLVSTAIAEGVK